MGYHAGSRWRYCPTIAQVTVDPTDSRRFTGRLADTVGTLGRELVDAGGGAALRVRRLFALVLAGCTQALDRGRILIILLPLTFDRILEFSTRNGLGATTTAAFAGIGVGTVFFCWGWLVGHSFHWSMREFPATTEVFQLNHPAAVSVISGAIDGFPRDAEEYRTLNGRYGPYYEFGPYAHKLSFRSKVSMGVVRGIKTAFIFGTTAHVGMATINGFSPLAVRTRIWVVALEAAAVLATVAVAVSLLVSHDFLGVAERVRSVITDRRILVGASVVIIVASAVDNAVRRRAVSMSSV